MPRPRRSFRYSSLYHVVQRGNKGQFVLLDDQDFQFSLSLLFRKAVRYKVIVHDFCLTHTQGHWLLQPTTKDGISNLMRDMQSQTSKYMNAKYKHRPWKFFVPLGTDDHKGRKWWRRQGDFPKGGVNWAQRFFATELEPAEYLAIRAYLYNGPVRAGVCLSPADYCWSGTGLRTMRPESWKLLEPSPWTPVSVFVPPEGPGPGQVDLERIFSEASRSRVAFGKLVARIGMKRPLAAPCRSEPNGITMEQMANQASLPSGP
ncbi:MAG: transposase [Bryobacteraceae bacterium]